MKAGVAGFPDPASRAAALWAWAITINGASEKKDAAWQFVQWWTSTEVGVKCGYFSTKDSIRAAYKAMPNPPYF